MPRQVNSVDEFKRLIANASAIKVVKRGDEVKLKLRTKKTLYTFLTNKTDADTIVKESKLPVEEF